MLVYNIWINNIKYYKNTIIVSTENYLQIYNIGLNGLEYIKQIDLFNKIITINVLEDVNNKLNSKFNALFLKLSMSKENNI